MKALIVYPDRRVKHVDLPRSIGDTYREVRQRPFAVTVDIRPEPIPWNVDVFRRRGYTFAKEPIFCGEGLDVLEAVAIQLCSNDYETRKHSDEDLRRQCRNHIFKASQMVIPIDEWHGDVPTHEDEADQLRATHMAKLGVRMIAVVEA